jgi:hypothetical protein
MGYMLLTVRPVARLLPVVWVVGGSPPSRKGGGSDFSPFLFDTIS